MLNPGKEQFHSSDPPIQQSSKWYDLESLGTDNNELLLFYGLIGAVRILKALGTQGLTQ